MAQLLDESGNVTHDFNLDDAEISEEELIEYLRENIHIEDIMDAFTGDEVTTWFINRVWIDHNS